ncbi:MAG: chorismate mutase [Solobacterium sp.]|nr:chorismate mutase [Solobacterium sp.]
MNDLEYARKIIDETDKELVSLFEKRMNAVQIILRYKQEHGLPVYDPEREKNNLEQRSKLIESEELKPYFLKFYQNLMDISKTWQEDHME